jgi:anti-sigma regulatory factor (Ser/Thr protein kinase)
MKTTATMLMLDQAPPAIRSAQGTVLAYLRLTIEPESVGVARRFISMIMGSWGLSGVDEAELLVSEVVTNVVRHVRSSDTMRINVKRHRDLLRVEVHDPSTELPVQRETNQDSESGHGMFLVDSLSQYWGCQPFASGKVVWFEISI